ncbi:hypothetical protein ACFPVT_01650 [Corynebacterium choanae]|uniref:Uncharacterized protein n=1 Tax=Corynebacterium choanae TaxID=1862358 RepID=A0A3G6J801_9CORY|nr:hypothetical protein [Corynebacterium choanae]AZA12570.1 hypothetical protein CCHOA_00705 [Corynebacterium choanae]
MSFLGDDGVPAPVNNPYAALPKGLNLIERLVTASGMTLAAISIAMNSLTGVAIGFTIAVLALIMISARADRVWWRSMRRIHPELFPPHTTPAPRKHTMRAAIVFTATLGIALLLSAVTLPTQVHSVLIALFGAVSLIGIFAVLRTPAAVDHSSPRSTFATSTEPATDSSNKP